MSEMRTQITQGRKARRIVAVVLMLAMLFSAVAVMSASAATGLFKVSVYDNVNDGGAVETGNEAVDGKANFSSGVSVNLKTDRIFVVEDYADMSQVQRLELTVQDKATNITVSKENKSAWTSKSSGNTTVYSYSNPAGIDKTTFDNLMNAITVKLSKTTSSASSVKLTLKGGSDKDSIGSDSLLGKISGGKGTTYTEVLTFFTYATAEVDPDSVEVQFYNEASDQTAEEPEITKRGTVTFNVRVTNVGAGSFFRLGYQVKESTQTWDNTTTTLYAIDENKYKYQKSNSIFNPWGTSLGTVNSSTGVVTNPKPIKITVDAADAKLNPEKEYDIRAVVVTNSDIAAYTKATNVPRVKYTQPVISTLNIGNTAPQKGGVEKEITSAIEFNNRNYDTTTGPQLKWELYFTTNRVSNGGVDASNWGSPIATDTRTLEKNSDGSYKTSLNITARHNLPTNADSKASAYKLVVTDLNANSGSGYYVTKYSEDTFVLDNNPPSKPTVTASGFSSDQLASGSAVVGGANSTVALTIGGSVDAGSGVKEYTYEMYYLESDKVNNFITEQRSLEPGATNAQILQAMKTLSTSNPSTVCEYTPNTSLSLNDQGNSTLSISKDGFYAVRVVAVDNVGRESSAAEAIFRVDLTPPTAPVIALAEQVNNKEDIANPNGGSALASNKFKEYDDRVYGDSRVWVFVKTDAQAGKIVPPENYQFSINGGLVWRSIRDAVNFKGTDAYTLLPGTVTIYNSNYSGTTTFAYDAAFQLSCNEINGYQTVMVRAVDSMGNTSLPSNSLSMRTTEIIKPVGSIAHEGIEVAISLGNTTLETTDKIEPDLRNDIALKINEKYFGADHATNSSNPIRMYLYEGGDVHQCTWSDSASSTCLSGSNCPYVKNADKASFYNPSMVNLQGVDAGVEDAAESFEWVRFDHAMYVSENVPNKGTVYFPTVVFDGGVSASGGSSTNILHTASSNLYDPTKSTYQAKVGNTTYTRYTAMKDYVVYTGQNEAVAATTPVTSLKERTTSLGTGFTIGDNKDPAPLSGNGTHAWESTLAADTYNALGHYTAGNTSTVARRVYHMVDMTKTDPDTSLGTLDYAEGEARMQTIHAFGYESGSSRDWMFAYNGQATRKEIFFTIDDNYISPHANDAYGFFFNTTIRQNIEGEWVVSGYLFLLGNYAAVGSSVTSIKVDRFIVRLTDVRLDWFANSRINSQGVSYAQTSDDFLLSLVQNASKQSTGTMTYGSQKIELLAYAPNDGVDKTVRNYVFVTVGASAEAYVWNKKVEAGGGKTARQKLQEQFDKDVKEIEKVVDTKDEKTDPVTTDGFVKIHWKKFNNSEPYENTNPSDSAKGVGTDHVLYVKRPVVDGKYNVGDLSGFEDTDDPTTAPHSDSNCFGFGPISMARSSSHTCSRDSLVVFSNVTLRAQKANSLSDVITQPKWGTGKVKYILNISDDSIQDLTDPIMSANVAWRIQTDSAKFISWGSLINRKTTVDFIESKIENNGTYVVSRVTSYDDDDTIHPTTGSHKGLNAPGQRSQSKQVAEYIADTYYKSYGITLGAGEKAPDKVNEQLSKGGAVYSLSNAKQMQFSVTPESYNSGTANEDFPSGRWYITYDATGYGKLRTSYARFSDAFDLKVNEPGRYQVYFAPDKTKLGANQRIPTDDTLDPATAIFNFVVSDDAYAQPVATVDDAGNITVDDFSIDPDNGALINSADYATFYEGNQLLTGISATRWRWELAAPYTDPVTKEQLSITLMKSDWKEYPRTKGSNGQEMNPFTGMTVTSLTKTANGLLASAIPYVNKDASMKQYSSGTVGTTGYHYTKVPDGATITLYEQVQEIATVRYMENGVLKYKEAGKSWSPEKSANLISSTAGSKPIRPASSITLSKTTIYDTADSGDAITVTRNSFHGQKKQLNLGFTVIQGSGATAKTTDLTSSDGGKNWYMGGTLVLALNEAPSFNTTTGQTTGTWNLSKAAIEALCNRAAGNFTLKITETVDGTDKDSEWPDGTKGAVTDSSSRTIYYTRDERAPSMQTVTMETGTNDGGWKYDEYEASNYLDMTTPGTKQIRVTVNGAFDNEGVVEGYGYSFYEYDPAHPGDMAYATYYYMNPSTHRLYTAGKGENGVKNAIIRTGTNAGRGILTNSSKNVGENDPFYIIIDENTMYLDDTERRPTAVLNLGIFAFDNQTNNQTPSPGATFSITGANETIRTKVENIKLAKFTPMPVAITAVNTTGETVARIGNDEALKGGTDVMENPIPVANTKVTVSFTPRQDWFQVASGGVALATPVRVTNAEKIKELDATGDPTGEYIKYFTDKSGAADLTNRVTIDYIIERKAPGAADFTQLKAETDAAYTTTYSIDQGGDYRVTAQAKNGSGVYSTVQVLTFSVDREKPDPAPIVTIYDDSLQPYKSGDWVRSATVSVTGSKDADTKAYYRYSIDNGAHWTDQPNLNDFQFTIQETGTHSVRVKAVDTGGNEAEAATQTVMVDNTPPKVSPPNTKVESQSVTVFKESIISIAQMPGGMVYSLNADDTANMKDQDVIVEPGNPASFVIVPDAGKRVATIMLGETAYSTGDLTPHATIARGLVLTIPTINDDAILTVTFADEGAKASYMETARTASINSLNAMRAAMPEFYANEDAPVAIAATYQLEIVEDIAATETTSDLGNDLAHGESPTLTITAREGYRVTELYINRFDGNPVTVPASALNTVVRNQVYTYVLANVTGDVQVTVRSMKKTPATVTFDVDGNGSIIVDTNKATIKNDTYTYATYEDDEMELEIVPQSNYELSSLTINGKEQVSGKAVSTYTTKVEDGMQVKAQFKVTDTGDPLGTSYIVVNVKKDDGGLTHGSISPRGEVSEDPLTSAEKHVISVSTDSDQTILLKPDPTYTPTVSATILSTPTTLTPVEDPVTGYYSVTLTKVAAEMNDIILNVSFVGRKHAIETEAWTKPDVGTDLIEGGGTVVLKADGEAIPGDAVLEGTDVKVEITPDAGYRIESVKMDGVELGKRRSFEINYLKDSHKIVATFVKRSFGAARTTHSLSVTAVGISDGQQSLHSEAYSFRLNDGQWSPFQAGTNYTYPNAVDSTPLEPNTEYTVTVRARDKLLNVSDEKTIVGTNAKTTYTLANVPAALDVEAADDTDNVTDKTVKVTVDPMGNPANTEYCVYYDDRSDMRNRKLATVDLTGGGQQWSTLDGLGQLTVYHLAPGTKYYLQVAARNMDGIPTEANDQNVLDITLSPTAPPDNTLYFEEPEYPGAPIKLHWDDPMGEVLGFQIYRDGTLIKTMGKDDRDTEDSYNNLRGDAAYVYSYAYQNSAGVGARRTAVSEEYYDRAKALAEAKKAGGSTAAEEAALKQLDNLVGTYTNLYREVMTYPTFPAYFTKVYAMPLGTTTYNGEMQLRIQPDSGTTARAQRYKVGLNAYDKGVPVPDGTSYGDNQKWNSASTETYTVCTSSVGATVTWKGLNTEWDYRVYVKEVTSTGWTTYTPGTNSVTDGYQSGTTISPEAGLYRRYFVTPQGYGYRYEGSSGAKGILNEPSANWSATLTADSYTSRANDTYTGWASKGYIELSARTTGEGDNFIKFNKSPQIYIPQSGSGYDLNYMYGTGAGENGTNFNNELNVYSGNRYLLVEQADGSMKVKLRVKVYDPDGPADGNLNYTVTGTLGGVTAKATLAPASVDVSAVGTDEASATECVLEFDLKNLATGVYNDLKLSVANGSIGVDYDDKGEFAKSVNVVVNQSLPTISALNGGGTKKIEAGRDYGTDSKLTVETGISANNMDNLRKVRMILMEDLYTQKNLGSLFTKIINGTASEAEKKQIDEVQPPKISYFQVSDTIYKEALQLPEVMANAKLAITTEPTAGVTYYWVEKEIALTKGWCDFLTRDADGHIKAGYKSGDKAGATYPVLIVANFGKNQSTMNLRFQVMDAPSLIVETEQTWQWVQTTSQEYDHYYNDLGDTPGTWTIGDVYEDAKKYHALNDENMTPESVDPSFVRTNLAMEKRQGANNQTEYWVFKLWDTKATIQSEEVSSYIQVKTGMYDKIEEAQVVMVPGVADDPSGGNEHAEPPAAGTAPGGGYSGKAVIQTVKANYQGSTALKDNNRAYFRVTNLEKSTTYYMWVYYKVVDPESGQNVWYHAKNSLAMTTDDDYYVSTVGFQDAGLSYEESKYDSTGYLETATLLRLGDYKQSAVTVEISAEYYRATQYGEYVLDEQTGQPSQIKPGDAEYQAALETLQLETKTQRIEKNNAVAGVSYRIRNTTGKQGHMIVKLIEKVIATDGDGINRVTTNADVLEIFVLDDESPITSYALGLDDTPGLSLETGGDTHMVAKHYDYKFNGLPDPYGSADTSSLSLKIKNIGDGEITNIEAKLWNSSKTAETKDFVFATQPTVDSLASPDGTLAASERSELKIVPTDGLQDGIYEGWLEITANRVKSEDVIWVHLYQVVGQATLKGNIYIGENKPATTTEFVGFSTVKIYDSKTATGTNRGEPLYQAETDANGYFEIPNILKNQEYCIVVERIGCATYDGLAKEWTWRPRNSSSYLFDLRAVAGDINGDGIINSTDRTELERYMNHTVAEAEEAGDMALAEAIRRCDLDQNGGVNSIDRMLLWSNLNKGTVSGGVTIPVYRAVDPVEIIE